MIKNNVGNTYDVVFFGAVEFNKKTVCDQLFHDENADVSEKLPEYCAVKSIVGKIPPYLQVFWTFDDSHRSVVSCLLDEIDWVNADFDTYIKQLTEYIWLKSFFIETHWPKLTKKAVAEIADSTNQQWIYNLFDETPGPEKYSFKLKYVLDNWNEVVYELLMMLIKIHKAIMVRMDYNKSMVKKFYAQFSSAKVLKKVAAELNYDEEKLKNGYVSFSLLNPIMQYRKYNSAFIVFGIDTVENLSLEKKYNVTFDSLRIIFGDATRNEIIKVLMEKQYCTCVEISKSAHCSRQTINYHLDLLTHEGIIMHSHTSKRVFYYCLNADYVDKLREFVNNMDVALKRN